MSHLGNTGKEIACISAHGNITFTANANIVSAWIRAKKVCVFVSECVCVCVCVCDLF